MTELALEAGGQYGAVDLKKNYQKYLMRGVAFATVLHFMGVGAYYAPELIGEEEEPTAIVRIMKYNELGPPPSITNQSAPAISVTAPTAKPSVGIPVPVPDAEVSPEQTIASQAELSQAVGPINESPGGGEIRIEDDGPPPDFVPYEKAPQPIKQVQPLYPEIATRAGVEGTVWVKIWVDKEGKARKAVVMKSDAELFNQSATEAAMQWVFTPAMQHNGPVSVWVAIPFRFKLTGR